MIAVVALCCQVAKDSFISVSTARNDVAQLLSRSQLLIEPWSATSQFRSPCCKAGLAKSASSYYDKVKHALSNVFDIMSYMYNVYIQRCKCIQVYLGVQIGDCEPK